MLIDIIDMVWASGTPQAAWGGGLRCLQLGVIAHRAIGGPPANVAGSLIEVPVDQRDAVRGQDRSGRCRSPRSPLLDALRSLKASIRVAGWSAVARRCGRRLLRSPRLPLRRPNIPAPWLARALSVIPSSTIIRSGLVTFRMLPIFSAGVARMLLVSWISSESET